MLEILNRVEAETGSLLAAYAWFRAEPLPGFGGATPDLLLREGKKRLTTYMPTSTESWRGVMYDSMLL